MKLFTLKRFFVVTLLMCLGISQGWAETGVPVTLGGNDGTVSQDKKTVTWSKEGVTFTLSSNDGTLTKTNNAYFQMDANKTYTLSWSATNNDFDIEVTNATFKNSYTREGKFFGITWQTSSITFQASNASSGVKNESVSNNATAWKTTSINSNPAVPNDGNFTITTGKSSEGATTFKYYLGDITLKINKKYSYSATANVVSADNGTAFIVDNGGTTYTQSVENPTAENTKDFIFQLSATPNDGYLFAGWSKTAGGEIVSVENPYSATITCDPDHLNVEDTWYANFATPRTLYAAVDIQVVRNADDAFDGTVSGGDMQSFATGAESYPFDFNLNAEGSSTYQFVGWSTTGKFEDIESDVIPYPVSVTSSSTDPQNPATKTVYAHFKKLRTYSATVKVMSVRYEYGKDREEPVLNKEYSSEPLAPTTDESHIFNFANLTANLMDDYTFMGWSENASASESDFVKDGTYNIDIECTKDNTNRVIEVYAFFKKKITYSAAINVVKVSDSGSEITGTITGDGQQTFVTEQDDHTFNFNLKATGNVDYEFKGWANSEEDAKAGIYFKPDANHTVEITCTAANPIADTQTLYAYFKHCPLHYSKVVLKAVGNGGVYAVGNGTPSDNDVNSDNNYGQEKTVTQNGKSSETEITHRYGRLAVADAGYVFDGWYKDAAATEPVGKDNSRTEKFEVTTASTDANAPETVTLYAKFVSVDEYVKSMIKDEGYSDDIANELLSLLQNTEAVQTAKSQLPTDTFLFWTYRVNPWTNQNNRKANLDKLTFTVLDEENNATDQPSGTFDAALLDRTFYGGEWNTFCVPFDMTKGELKEALGDNGIKIKALTSVTVNENSGNKVLGFSDTDNIAAGESYLVYISNDIEKGAKHLGAANVTVGTPASTTVDGSIIFQGTYSQSVAPKNSYIIYENKFYFVDTDGGIAINAFRGYFTEVDGGGAKDLSITFDDNDVTGITSVTNGNDNGDDNLYNIAGQRVNENAKGIIIKNGKKYFVK